MRERVLHSRIRRPLRAHLVLPRATVLVFPAAAARAGVIAAGFPVHPMNFLNFQIAGATDGPVREPVPAIAGARIRADSAGSRPLPARAQCRGEFIADDIKVHQRGFARGIPIRSLRA